MTTIKIASALLAVMLLWTPMRAEAASPTAARLDALEAAVATLQGQVSTLQGQVTTLQGQVATLQSPPRFVDNGNGTVTDHQTGLTWEKKLVENDFQGNCDAESQADRSIHCVNNAYQWSSSGSDADGGLFTDFLERINAALSTSPDGVTVADVCFAGHCDWRVPNIAELQTILAPCPGGGAPCIDPIFGPTAADPTAPDPYWSSTSFASLSDVAWDLQFNGGGRTAGSKSNGFRVRAVRGGS